MPVMIRITTLVLLIVLSSLSPGQAEATDEFLITGRRQFSQGEFEAAYQSFFRAFKRNPADVQINFMLGRSAFESGRLEEAVMAYERVLIQDPDASRIKLEMARTHLGLGARNLAERLFLEVLADHPPDAVQFNIRRYLLAIAEAKRKHFFKGAFTMGIGYDDNVRTAPVDDIIRTVIGDVNLTGPTAGSVSNYLFNTTLNVNHIYRPSVNSSLSLKSRFTNYNNFNETANDLDINLIGLQTGPVWHKAKFTLESSLIFNHIDLGYDRYLGIYGLGCLAIFQHSPHLVLNSSLTLLDKNYFRDGGKDAVNTSISLNPVFTYGRNRLSLTAGYEKESAHTDLNNSYEQYSLSCRYDRQLFRTLNASFSWKREESDYQGIDPMFNEAREDRTDYFGAGLSAMLWNSADRKNKLIGRLGHTFIDSDSTIALYEYTKNVTSAAFTFTF